MGIGGISIGSLLVVLVIVMLLFGTKKLRNVGGDLGGAIKGFRNAMKDGESTAAKSDDETDAESDSARLAGTQAESRAEETEPAPDQSREQR